MQFLRSKHFLFDIIITIILVLAALEGLFLILEVTENTFCATLASYDEQLDCMMNWLEGEDGEFLDPEEMYARLAENTERIPGSYLTCSILNADKQVVAGDSISYTQIPSIQFYSDEQDYFAVNHVGSLFPKFFSDQSHFERKGGSITMSAQEVSNWLTFLEMPYLDLVTDEMIYYEKEFTAEDGQAYSLVIGRYLTVPGAVGRQMAYIVIIYAGVVLLVGVVILCHISASKKDYQKIYHIAYVDRTTGLRNRTKFELDAALYTKYRKQKTKYAIVCIDIRKFRVIMEYYGKEQAGQILKEVADILKTELDKKELCAKDKNDVFLLLCVYDNIEELKERIRVLNGKLEAHFEKDKLKFAYGVYCIQDYSKDWKRLINYAYMAKDVVKESTKDNILFMDEDKKEQMHRERELESEMENALQKKEIVVYLQPKYSTDGASIGGAEALARWNSPKLGFVSPGEFIKLFEKNGFIVKLDRYMLDAVCQIQKKWMEEGKNLITISVNISRVHLMMEDMVQDIIKIIDSYRIPRNCIELEITESAFFDDKAVMINTIEELQKAGFTVSMDDFGAGYSSLNSLKDLSLDVIKLDGEFFRESANENRSQTIVRDTIDMAKDLQMKIVAEGVEKKDQVGFLDAMGCDLIQGFYFAKPMPIDEFEKIVYGLS